ncbi:uncharacterized protein LOC106152460 [Lingula anatina]|uniref:Uncharacterized protein LOC106152460 n=1 Tax=Lingula anatina TaxID=7574 RepID=A0A1S3H7P1_LINAN|nr:uncharacterized protein LOC106152460 [Lingula anatina]|eukprot:XP_013381506.1 uncharacterized protein LOC106152460 [Lingula anatina]
MADGEDENFSDPYAVSTDEKGPEDYVRVQVVVLGLQAKNTLQGFKMVKKPANFTVDVKYEDRSFTLLVFAKDKDKKKNPSLKNCKVHIKKLPDEIIPSDCYYKVDKELITIFLHKAKSRSWERDLATHGLDTYTEEDGVSS